MSTGYDPNIEGAITVLVDLMSGLSLAMPRSPYAANYRGLVDALIDLKEGLPSRVGNLAYTALVAGEALTSGNAVYVDTATGRAFKAVANQTLEKATVIGFAQENVSLGVTTNILLAGALVTTGLTTGAFYFLSANSAGSVTATPPSTAGQFVTRVGEAGSSTNLAVRPEPPILLS
jgi:hypothetical protein